MFFFFKIGNLGVMFVHFPFLVPILLYILVKLRTFYECDAYGLKVILFIYLFLIG